MGFPRQEDWSGLPLPSPGDLPDPGIEPAPLASPALAGGLFATSTTWEALVTYPKCLLGSPEAASMGLAISGDMTEF